MQLHKAVPRIATWPHPEHKLPDSFKDDEELHKLHIPKAFRFRHLVQGHLLLLSAHESIGV